MNKITVEISAKGYTGLTAENIKKALDNYFGSPTLNVSFSVIESAQLAGEADSATPRGERLSPEEYGRRLAMQMNDTPQTQIH